MTKHGLRHGTTSMLLGLALLFAPACDDGDDGDDGDDDLGDGDSEIGSDTDQDGGDGGFGDGDGDDGGDGDGDGDGGKGGDGDGDELMGCAALLSEAECGAENGCSPVMGNELIEDGAEGWCTEPELVFIGCAFGGDLCPMLTKTLCDGDTIWRTTDCVPGNVTACEAPGEISGVCG